MDFLSTLCRLCLDGPGECHLFDVENLSYDIEIHLGIKVLHLQNLPNCICKRCLEVIKNARELRTLAIKNDFRLQYIHNKSEKEMEPVNVDQIDRDIEKTKSGNVIHHSAVLRIPDTGQQGAAEIQISSYKSLAKVSVRKDLYQQTTVSHSQTTSRSEETFKKIKRSSVTFSDVSMLPRLNDKNNIKQVSEEKTEVHHCPFCNKPFTKWKKFYLHQRMHIKSFACPIPECGKKFATKGDLDKHVRVHTGERPYECAVCHKRFTQRCTLRSHLENVHSQKVSIHSITNSSGQL